MRKIPIMVLDTATGKKSVQESIRMVSRKLGISPRKILRAIYEGECVHTAAGTFSLGLAHGSEVCIGVGRKEEGERENVRRYILTRR